MTRLGKLTSLESVGREGGMSGRYWKIDQYDLPDPGIPDIATRNRREAGFCEYSFIIDCAIHFTVWSYGSLASRDGWLVRSADGGGGGGGGGD